MKLDKYSGKIYPVEGLPKIGACDNIFLKLGNIVLKLASIVSSMKN